MANTTGTTKRTEAVKRPLFDEEVKVEPEYYEDFNGFNRGHIGRLVEINITHKLSGKWEAFSVGIVEWWSATPTGHAVLLRGATNPVQFDPNVYRAEVAVF